MKPSRCFVRRLPRISRALLISLFGLVISFSGTAMAMETHSWEGSLDKNISKEITDPDSGGGKTVKYYSKDSNGNKHVVQIDKYKKGHTAFFYHWITYFDPKTGNKFTEEISITAAGATGTRTELLPNGNTANYSWNSLEGRWVYTGVTEAPATGAKRAPAGDTLKKVLEHVNIGIGIGGGHTVGHDEHGRSGKSTGYKSLPAGCKCRPTCTCAPTCTCH